MKKRLISIMALCLTVCLALSGCGVTGFSNIKVEGTQNTNYAVYSNGGNAVSYGNYLYFINGTRGYEDANAKQNEWKKVDKGGLYRTEFYNDPKINTDPNSKDFIPSADPATGLEFVSSKGKDYDEKEIDVVGVQQIASKVIGTSGYDGGGIFIYDNYVYYATPNNEKDKTGTVQITKTDFMRSRLDGKDTVKIYTTDATSNASPYKYYKQNGKVYLVCYYANKIVSVAMTDKKVEKPVVIAEDVTSCYLPHKSTYIASDPTNTTEDFIYYTRNVKEGEAQKTGNVLEVARPDGTEGAMYLMTGGTVTLESVRDGLLFYRMSTTLGTQIINYDNLHNFFMKNSPTYATYQSGLKDGDPNKVSNITGTVFDANNIADYTTTYCYRPNRLSNIAYMLGSSTSGIYLFSAGSSEVNQVVAGEATTHFIDGNDIYFSMKDASILYSVNIYEAADKTTEKMQISHTDMVASGLKADKVAGYVMYFAKVDEWADGYAFFKKVDGIEGGKEQFIGKITKDDLKPEEDEEKK